jgi:sodium-dependent dicarboxylate transporter 2/3/5
MGALALFFLPAGDARPGPLARWEDARDLPWGVLILFGGELSLAGAFAKTGLAAWLGGAVEAAGAGPAWVFILAAVALIIFLTELTSNTATTAAFLPVLGLVAAGAGIAPLQLTVPAAVAASCAFMLPVATPPNAIVFASGHVTIGQMMRAGFVLNLAGVVVITLFADLVLPLVPWMGR